MQKIRRAPLWRVLASVLTGALIASGAALGVAVPAQAADGPSISVTPAPRAGGTVTVSGSGFAAAAPGVYLGIGPAGLPGFYQGASSISQVVWIAPGNPAGSTDAGLTAPMAADGTFTVQLTAPAYAENAPLAIYTSKAHGQGFMDPSQNVVQPVSYAAPPATGTTTTLVPSATSSVEGQAVTLTATVSPAADGTVDFRDGTTSLGTAAVSAGSASTSVSTLSVGMHALSAVFTPADAGAFTGSTSSATSVTVTAKPAAPVPTVTVSKTNGLDADGETVTVSGTGFVANAPSTSGTRAPLAGRFTGTYVVFGSFADVWQPSAGAASATRKGFDTKWAVLAGDMAAVGGAARGAIELTPEGTFSTTLTVSEATEALADGNWGVYTYSGGGAVYAPFETYTPISFAEVPAEPVVPTVTVSKTTGLDPAGETVTVTGSGFVANAPATSGTRPPLAGKFAGAYVTFGSFADVWQPTANAASSARKTFDTKWGVLADDINAVGGPAAGAIEITPEGTFSTTLTVSEAADALADGNWGVYTYGGGGAKYAPFETYTPIAFAETPVEPEVPAEPEAPAITVSPATNLDPGKTNVLTITGENYTGPGAANGAYVLFGETSVWSGGVALPAGGWIAQAHVQKSQITDGAFTTTLTIPAGTLDATKTYQVATSAAHGLSVTDRSLDAFAPVTVAAPAAPFVGFPLGADVQPGQTLSIAGGGFTPGDVVTAVANSTPVTIGSATASASGTVAFSWAVPADFAPGAHTLTLSVGGSVVASAPFTVTAAAVLPAVETPEAPSCVAQSVSGASIQWGLKASFVNYINTTANGTISGGWGAGAGAYSTDTDRGRVGYTGAVHYTGHSGLLDMTLSNPRIQVNSATSASLILNVQSTDATGGSAVNASGIVFATLSLPAASESSNRISWSNASATLTAAGAEAFAGFYAAGTALDPVSFSFPLGAEVPCDSTTTGDLAATGGESSVDVVWLGAGLLALGALLVVARRRRLTV